jgi:hypothetical protein
MRSNSFPKSERKRVIGTRERKRHTHWHRRARTPRRAGYGPGIARHTDIRSWALRMNTNIRSLHCVGDVHTYDPGTGYEYTHVYTIRGTTRKYIHTAPVFRAHIYDSYCRAERERGFVRVNHRSRNKSRPSSLGPIFFAYIILYYFILFYFIVLLFYFFYFLCFLLTQVIERVKAIQLLFAHCLGIYIFLPQPKVMERVKTQDLPFSNITYAPKPKNLF